MTLAKPGSLIMDGDFDDCSTFVLHVVIHIHDICNLGGGEGRDCLRGDCQLAKQAATGIKNSPHLSDRILALLERNWLETRKE